MSIDHKSQVAEVEARTKLWDAITFLIKTITATIEKEYSKRK